MKPRIPNLPRLFRSIEYGNQDSPLDLEFCGYTPESTGTNPKSYTFRLECEGCHQPIELRIEEHQGAGRARCPTGCGASYMLGTNRDSGHPRNGDMTLWCEQTLINVRDDGNRTPYFPKESWETEDVEVHYPQCLVPKCNHEGNIRGLCEAHFEQAHQLVQNKRTTWEELIINGKVLPPQISEEERWFLNKR